MSGWTERIQRAELADGSTALQYHFEFDTLDDVTAKRVEIFFQSIINGDRSCKTCYYIDEYLGGVFFCRRVKESKRVKPDFYCKKWRGEPNGRSNQQTSGDRCAETCMG